MSELTYTTDFKDATSDSPDKWLKEPTSTVFNLFNDNGVGMTKLFRMDLAKQRRDQGLSTFALSGTTIVGERLVEPWTMFVKNMSPKHFEQTKSEFPFLACLINLIKHAHEFQKTFLETHSDIPHDKIAHFCGLAVSPAFRRQGVARKLTEKTIIHLKKEGYKLVFVETTGDGSGNIMKSMKGSVELGFISYDKYCAENNYPVIKDHVGYGFYAILL